MSGFAIEQIQEQMRQLKLVRTAEQLPLLLQDASKGEVAYSEFLADLLGRELAAKQERHTAMKTTMARFPFQKSLESFDFKFQPSIEPKVVRELATGRFLADVDNVLLLGPPGVGKTHLAVALGLRACALGFRTVFVTASGLIASLTRAHNDSKGARYMGLPPTERAPKVSPWKLPKKLTKPERPVYLRAVLSAPSIASAPLLVKYVTESGCGTISANLSAKRTCGSWIYSP